MQFELLDVPFTKGRCIIVPATLFPCDGRIKDAAARFILDTGATSTHISRRYLNKQGYKDAAFTKDTRDSLSTMGKYKATLCNVRQLRFNGLTFKDCTIKVWETPKDHHVSGIIGMDLLRRFNININMDTGRTVVTRSQATIDLLAKN